MRSLIAILIPAILALPVGASEDLITLQIKAATLGRVLQLSGAAEKVELPPAATGDGAIRVTASVTGVPRKRFHRVLLAAAGLEGEEVSGTLWVRRSPDEDFRKLRLADLEGFETLFVDGRDVRAEVLEREESLLDPLTRAYFEYRRGTAKAASRDRSRGDSLRGGNSFLGVRLASKGGPLPATASNATRETLERWDGWGAFISDVVPEAPAAFSGVLPGDVVVKFAGLWVDSANTLIRLVSRAEVGREIEIEVLREGAVRREYVVIQEREEPARN